MLRFIVIAFAAFLAFSSLSAQVAEAQVILWGEKVSPIEDDPVPAAPQTVRPGYTKQRLGGLPPERRYTGTLIASYVPGPLLLLILGGVEASRTSEWAAPNTLLVVMATASLLAPSLTHLANGESLRARQAALGSLGASTVAGILGFFIATQTAGEPDPEVIDDSIFRSVSPGVPGIFIGAGLGLAAWGIFDVVRTHRADTAKVQVAWLPTPEGGVVMMRGTF